MSDEELRALERIAATGGIEEKVRLAQARCKMGQHSWSEWASRSNHPLADWERLAEKLGITGESRIGRTTPSGFVPFGSQARFEIRQCFWCGLEERRIVSGTGLLTVDSNGTVRRTEVRADKLYDTEHFVPVPPVGAVGSDAPEEPSRGMGDWISVGNTSGREARIRSVSLSVVGGEEEYGGEVRCLENSGQITNSTAWQDIQESRLAVPRGGKHYASVEAMVQGEGEIALTIRANRILPVQWREYWGGNEWHPVRDEEGWGRVGGTVELELEPGDELIASWRAAHEDLPPPAEPWWGP